MQRIALRVLSQDCSSSATERNWSAWGLIQTKRRNRLSFSQMKKLVYVQTNLRILEDFAGNQVQELNPDSIDIGNMPSLPSREKFHDSYSFLYDKMAEQSARLQQRARTRSLKEAYSTAISVESEYEDSARSSEDIFESLLGTDSSHSSCNSSHEDVDSAHTSSQSSFSSADYEDPHAYNHKKPRFSLVSSLYET